jgi:hypothetical protein
MADGGSMQMHPTDGAYGATVMHPFDGALLVFQRYGDLWMIDHIPAPPPSNARSLDDDDVYDDTGDDDGYDTEASSAAMERATAVALDDLVALDGAARRAYHARQLHKLGLAPGSDGARAVWRLLQDPMRFAG